ncbi:unnamed protein product [Toxocara canis]|uniref:Uncharacterized protein n=1 Tax=Toxocara canis TaxID=6265 RepID=A0A183VH89_TOXCA|nr:unnamed protein product [Toxocara canis]
MGTNGDERRRARPTRVKGEEVRPRTRTNEDEWGRMRTNGDERDDDGSICLYFVELSERLRNTLPWTSCELNV